MRRRSFLLTTTALCTLGLITWAVAQTAGSTKPAAQNNIVTFKATTEIVLVNLTVRDRNGNLVTNLKPSEVSIYEDGKLQHISSFDFENVDAGPATASAAAASSGPAGTIEAGTPAAKKAAAPAAAAAAPPSSAAVAAAQYRDRRLFVLYFDLTTMQPEDVQNVMQQAETFVQTKMQPADLVSIVTLGDSLQLNEDFTDNKTALMNVLRSLNPATSSGFADGGDGSSDGTADDGSTFSADDTEFNVANADRSLESMQSVCDMLAGVQQKKSMVYFSSGIQRSGVDNEITLRSAVNSCVKANTAIYSVDAQGLQAMPPGGGATGGSVRGASAFNGGAQSSAFNSQFAQQETISTLST
ncbi:MAG: VWA domain-containing protein, partial [Gemmataceae bacterium]